MKSVEVRGSITIPRENETVSRRIEVKGNLSGLQQGQSVWLAIQIGNLYWPKEPEIIVSDGEWSAVVYESGSPPGGQFSLVLLVVSRKGNKDIEDWINKGNQTGEFPGLKKSDISEMKALHAVRLRLS